MYPRLAIAKEKSGSTFAATSPAALYSATRNAPSAAGGRRYSPFRLHDLGRVALRQGNTKRATAYFGESLSLNQELENTLLSAVCLAGLAAVAAAQGRAEPAARLFGAAEILLDASGSAMQPDDRAEYGHNVANTRAQLDEATFAAAWEAGRAMTLEQAIAEAIEFADVG